MNQRLTHIFLATMLLMGTVGVKVSLHYCNGQFSGLALFKEASSCHSVNSSCEKSTSACCAKNQQEDDCCNNKNKVVKSEFDQFFYYDQITEIEAPAALASLNINLMANYSLGDKPSFVHYRPPPRLLNRTIYYQNFLC